MKPIRIDSDGINIFTTRQIDDYGMPELWGYTKYQVIEIRDNFVSDYKIEQERQFTFTHRYSRIDRFKVTLLNLLGERGNIPDYVLTMVKTYLKPDSVDKWNDTRKLLKHFKKSRYYDNIPLILKQLKYVRCFPELKYSQIHLIMSDFQRISSFFEQHKHTYKRRYFPNMRFVVLKLLQKYGFTPAYPIPLVRTERKRKTLEALWTEIE